MKAFVYTKYGPPEVLQLKNTEIPVPGENEVLIKINTTAINDYDWSMLKGEPLIYRLLFGVLKPKYSIPGMELAGIIQEIGPGVRSFKAGDRVYGDISEYGFGTFAEYVCINEKAISHIPDGLSFEEATTIPHASMLAVQSLIEVGGIKNGQKILINGAGGGVGTFGVQIVKLYHAEVTGVDTGDKLETMQFSGFDHVIDFRKEDFTKNGEQYDLILDCKTNRSTFAYLHALKSKGIYVTVGGTISRLIQAFVCGPFISWFYKKKIKIVALKPNKDLAYIEKLYESGQIKCLIDGPYEFEKIPWAIRYFGEGRHKGKVVIAVE